MSLHLALQRAQVTPCNLETRTAACQHIYHVVLTWSPVQAAHVLLRQYQNWYTLLPALASTCNLALPLLWVHGCAPGIARMLLVWGTAIWFGMTYTCATAAVNAAAACVGCCCRLCRMRHLMLLPLWALLVRVSGQLHHQNMVAGQGPAGL